MTALLLFLAAQETIDDAIRAWGDEDIAIREKATEAVVSRWSSWTASDLAALRSAAAGTDAEVASRAREALIRVMIRRAAGARLMKVVRDLENRLVRGDETVRLELLEKAVELWQTGWIGVSELRGLADLAESQAWTIPPDRLIPWVSNHHLRPWVRLLLPLLQDENASTRRQACELVGVFGTREHVASLLPLLNDADETVRVKAIGAVGRLGTEDHAGRIAPLLRDEAPGVRQAAAAALGALRARRWSAEVAALLEDRETSVRRNALMALLEMRARDQADRIVSLLRSNLGSMACRVLGSLGESRHIRELAPLLTHEDENVRAEAVRAFARLDGAAESVVPLLRDPDERVRRRAVEALDRRKDRSQARAILPLLRDPDLDVAKAAAEALAHSRASELADDIAALLEDRDSGVRSLAVKLLGDLGAHSWTDAVAARLADAEPIVREGAVRALEALGAVEHAPGIAARLRDSDPDVAFMARCALSRLRTPMSATVPYLGDAAPGVRAHAALSLGIRREADAVTPLLPLLRDPAEEVRASVVQGLRYSGLPEFVPAVIPLLKDSNGRVRREAALTIGALGDPAMAESLMPLLRDEAARAAVMSSLAALNARDRADAMAEFLSDREEKVRSSAARSLASLRSTRHEEKLALALRDPYAEVREAAAWALGVLEARDRQDEVSLLLEDSIPHVRKAAILALLRMGARGQADRIAAIAWRDQPEATLALLGLDADRHAATILRSFEDDAWTMRTFALGDWGRLLRLDRPRVISALREWERSDERWERSAAAIGLLRLGLKDREARKQMLERSYVLGEDFRPLLLALLELEAPDRMDRLRAPIVLESGILTWKDLQGSFAQAGFRLEGRGSRFERRSGGSRVLLLDLLSSAMGDEDVQPIFEGDTIRLVGRAEAREFWKKRLE